MWTCKLPITPTKVIFAAVILSKHHVDSLAVAQELHNISGCYAVVLAGSLPDVQLLVIILNCHHASSLIIVMYMQIVAKPLRS